MNLLRWIINPARVEKLETQVAVLSQEAGLQQEHIENLINYTRYFNRRLRTMAKTEQELQDEIGQLGTAVDTEIATRVSDEAKLTEALASAGVTQEELTAAKAEVEALKSAPAPVADFQGAFEAVQAVLAKLQPAEVPVVDEA